MKKHFLALLLVLTFIFYGAAVKASPESDTHAALQRIYDEDSSAARQEGLEALYAHHAPDYFEITLKGEKKTLAEVKADAKKIEPYIQSVDFSFSVQDVQFQGNTTTVKCSFRGDMTLKGPQSETAQHIITSGTELDTWRKGQNGWMVHQSKALTENVTDEDGNQLPTDESGVGH